MLGREPRRSLAGGLLKVLARGRANRDVAELSRETGLEVVPERCPTSRLSCQVIMTPELDGIRVRVPSSQLEL